jgi:small subunit ribosomal protein S16
MGKKKQPFYRIVATDSRVARDGKYIEKIGHYNPVNNPPELIIDDEKALLWLNRGAIPTDTVKNLFSSKGIMLRFHLMKNGVEQEKIDEELKKWALLQDEKQKREEALKAQKSRDEKAEEKVETIEEKAPEEPVETADATEDKAE